ncbi:MAG: methionyl-tRNA formyltransferase [Phycisphaerales bacterium JB063]
MRLLFLGSGSFGLPTLERLHAQHELLAVVTQHDKPAGRKRIMTPTPVGQWAAEHTLPTFKQDNVNTEAFVQQVRDLKPDAAVVIAFGQKLSPELIDALGKLAVNLHSSLLPRYRGAAPINWAMINNDKETGVSVIGLAQRMDAGRIYAMDRLAIDPHETAGELHDRLAKLGPDAVNKVLRDLQNNTLHAIDQDDTQATKAPKLSKADGTVDFNQPADAVRARIHGLTPWPGCKVHWHRDDHPTQPPEVLTLLRVEADPTPAPGNPVPGAVLENNRIACHPGTITPLELQRPGKRAMTLKDFTAGQAFEPGQRMTAIKDS